MSELRPDCPDAVRAVWVASELSGRRLDCSGLSRRRVASGSTCPLLLASVLLPLSLFWPTKKYPFVANSAQKYSRIRAWPRTTVLVFAADGAIYCSVFSVLQGTLRSALKCIDYSQRYAWQRLQSTPFMRPWQRKRLRSQSRLLRSSPAARLLQRSVHSSLAVSQRAPAVKTFTGCAPRARATRRPRCSFG